MCFTYMHRSLVDGDEAMVDDCYMYMIFIVYER